MCGWALKPKPSRGAQPRHHLAPPRRREGATRSDVNTNGDGGSWSGLSRRRTQLDTVNGSASHSCSTDMDLPMGEINSLPALRHQPDGTQAMPVGDQHRCSVAMGRCDWPRRL